MGKRRDHKGRVLRSGESLCQDGRYRYTYYENGKQYAIYSWKLEKSDRVPDGKRNCKSLREQERELEIRRLIDPGDKECTMTVYELAEYYTGLRRDVRQTTRIGYGTVLNIIKKHPFGQWKIDKVKYSDAKRWMIELQDSGKKYSTLHNVRGVLRPAFRLAMEDELIDKNPFDFELSSVLVNDSEKREAVPPYDEKRFLDFIKGDKVYSKYYEGMYILFKTGLRISEFCGLTISDINFDEMTINIDHQLQRLSTMEYIIANTKSTCGTRVLPMTADVADCFRKIIKNRLNVPRKEPTIGGKTGFLYYDKNGKPMVALHWEHYFKYSTGKFNKRHLEQLPKITPHVCRHTYCSNMAKTGINPKSLQYLMGHSEISITMDTYTHLGLEDAKRELERVKEELALVSP